MRLRCCVAGDCRGLCVSDRFQKHTMPAMERAVPALGRAISTINTSVDKALLLAAKSLVDAILDDSDCFAGGF